MKDSFGNLALEISSISESMKWFAVSLRERGMAGIGTDAVEVSGLREYLETLKKRIAEVEALLPPS